MVASQEVESIRFSGIKELSFFKVDVSTLKIVEVSVSTAQKWVDKQSCHQGHLVEQIPVTNSKNRLSQKSKLCDNQVAPVN